MTAFVKLCRVRGGSCFVVYGTVGILVRLENFRGKYVLYENVLGAERAGRDDIESSFRKSIVKRCCCTDVCMNDCVRGMQRRTMCVWR